MRLRKPVRHLASLLFFLIIVGQVRPVAAHGGEEGLAQTADLLTTILSLMLASIISFIIWEPGQAKLKPRQYGIIALTILTATIHLLKGLDSAPWLTLNGLGYLGLLGALYLPLGVLTKVRKQIHWLFIGYTLLTIVLFFITHPWGIYNGSFEWLGLWTKVVELMLIGLLLIELK